MTPNLFNVQLFDFFCVLVAAAGADRAPKAGGLGRQIIAFSIFLRGTVRIVVHEDIKTM